MGGGRGSGHNVAESPDYLSCTGFYLLCLVFLDVGFEHYLRRENCIAAWRELKYFKKRLGQLKEGSVSLSCF